MSQKKITSFFSSHNQKVQALTPCPKSTDILTTTPSTAASVTTTTTTTTTMTANSTNSTNSPTPAASR